MGRQLYSWKYEWYSRTKGRSGAECSSDSIMHTFRYWCLELNVIPPTPCLNGHYNRSVILPYSTGVRIRQCSHSFKFRGMRLCHYVCGTMPSFSIVNAATLFSLLEANIWVVLSGAKMMSICCDESKQSLRYDHRHTDTQQVAVHGDLMAMQI